MAVRVRCARPQWLSLRGWLLLTGYVKGPPPDAPAEDVEVDRKNVRRHFCPRCEFRLRFAPFHRPEDRKYRVVGVCPICFLEREF